MIEDIFHEDIVKLSTKNAEIHDLASLHRNMTEEEYQALKLDIEKNGQLVPAWIYRNKIIDGRHRLRALKELDIEYIYVKKIKNNITKNELVEIIMSSENRRSDTPSQKAIRAYNLMSIKNINAREASRIIGCSYTDISKIKSIIEMTGIEYINQILEKGYVFFNGKKFISIQTLEKAIKKIMISDETKDNNTINLSDKFIEIKREIINMWNNGMEADVLMLEKAIKKIRQGEIS